MAGRPGTLPWDFSTFSGNEPVTTLSDNFSFLNNQINDSGIGFVSYTIDTGTTNNLILTLLSPPTAYQQGMAIALKPANTNTGACVINVNSLGNVSIVGPANKALTGGEISISALLFLIFDGTRFRICGPCPFARALFSQSSSQTIGLAGNTSASIVTQWTSGGTSFNVNLTNVSYGIPLYMVFLNNTGATVSLGMTITDPANTAMTSIVLLAAGGGAQTNILAPASFSLTNGSGILLKGSTQPGLTAYFSS
jgi:hypothetical protein